MEGFLMLGILLIVLLMISLFTRRKKQIRGWGIKKVGTSKIDYQERDSDGKWRSLTFEYEMYSAKVPRHALLVPKNWDDFPYWAHGRKQEILTRIKSTLKEPAYTYLESD